MKLVKSPEGGDTIITPKTWVNDVRLVKSQEGAYPAELRGRYKNLLRRLRGSGGTYLSFTPGCTGGYNCGNPSGFANPGSKTMPIPEVKS